MSNAIFKWIVRKLMMSEENLFMILFVLQWHSLFVVKTAQVGSDVYFFIPDFSICVFLLISFQRINSCFINILYCFSGFHFIFFPHNNLYYFLLSACFGLINRLMGIIYNISSVTLDPGIHSTPHFIWML